MASKVKVSLSLDERLVRDLEGLSRERQTPRSRLVEEALRFWQRRYVEEELKAGYEFMAKEDRQRGAQSGSRAGDAPMTLPPPRRGEVWTAWTNEMTVA